MFANALETAMGFTSAVVLSAIRKNGTCTASIGAFVVVNPEGWIVTAAHIMADVIALDREVTTAIQVERDRAALEADRALGSGERRRRTAALPKINPKSNVRYSALWGRPGVTITNIALIEGVDIAIGRLQPWDPAWATRYPEFKDPAQGIRPGKSLCRLGYPFHQFTPTYDPVTNSFTLPREALPIPIFASEGIIARFIDLQGPNVPVAAYRFRWIETSSPGLKGQSGGPLLDELGTIWGIQSNTFSYELGFEPQVKRGNPGQKEHQFLNAGRAVHPETIVGILNQHNVQFNLSAY